MWVWFGIIVLCDISGVVSNIEVISVWCLKWLVLFIIGFFYFIFLWFIVWLLVSGMGGVWVVVVIGVVGWLLVCVCFWISGCVGSGEFFCGVVGGWFFRILYGSNSVLVNSFGVNVGGSDVLYCVVLF